MRKIPGAITSFRAKPYKMGGSSRGIVIPKSKFDELILDPNKEYEWLAREVQP